MPVYVYQISDIWFGFFSIPLSQKHTHRHVNVKKTRVFSSKNDMLQPVLLFPFPPEDIKPPPSAIPPGPRVLQ